MVVDGGNSLDGLLPVTCNIHFVPYVPEHDAEGPRIVLDILHHEGPGALHAHLVRFAEFVRCDLQRKSQEERRSPAGRAGDPDGTPHPLGERPADGEAQSGARNGGIEGGLKP